MMSRDTIMSRDVVTSLGATVSRDVIVACANMTSRNGDAM